MDYEYLCFVNDNKSAFQKEPLEADGTISHAVERILAFVVQDASFYAAKPGI